MKTIAILKIISKAKCLESLYTKSMVSKDNSLTKTKENKEQ